MAEIFKSAWFQVAGLPLIFLLIGVYARRLGRRDGDDTPRRNDWAVATSILLMTFGTVASDLRNAKTGEEVAALLGWLIGLLIMLFISMDYDRHLAWERDESGLPKQGKRLFVGILIPDSVSLLIFAIYQYRKV